MYTTDTVTLQKTPTRFVKKFGTSIRYSNFRNEIIKQDRKNSIEKIKNFFYDAKNENYWPFEWKQAISFLKLLDYEASL